MRYREGDAHEMRQKFWHAMADSPFVMLQLDANPDSAAPMTAQLDRDADSAIWFFAHRDSHWAATGPATATFASKGHDLFARFAGTLVRETNRARLDQHWNNAAAAWFPGGKDDPDLLFLRMDLGDASIWNAEMGITASLKLALGMDLTEKGANNKVETTL